MLENIAKYRWVGIDRRVEDRIQSVLDSWIGTRYKAGQQVKGLYVDCMRFVAGVFDELHGYRRCPLPRLPADRSLHDRVGMMKAFHFCKRVYSPISRVRDFTIEPGDWLITGPSSGGPGHSLVAGSKKNQIWHCNRQGGVQRSGVIIPHGFRLFGVFRFPDKEFWLSTDKSIEEI